jgi:hypothetical protein
VIFDFGREPLVRGIERWAPRHRPGFEYAIQLETQIVMEAGRRMLLDDKTASISGEDRSFATRLRRFGEVPLCLIGRKLFA